MGRNWNYSEPERQSQGHVAQSKNYDRLQAQPPSLSSADASPASELNNFYACSARQQAKTAEAELN